MSIPSRATTSSDDARLQAKEKSDKSLFSVIRYLAIQRDRFELHQVLQTQTILLQEAHEAGLVDTPQGARRDSQAKGTAEFRDIDALALQVRQLTALGLIVSMRDIVARIHAFSGYGTST